MDFAKRNHYSFIGNEKEYKIVEVCGIEERFEVLQSFEFDSDRKRMSVIVKEKDGTIKLYIKGADTKIRERLSVTNPQIFQEKIERDISEFSKLGLRTLLVAMRIIEPSQYAEVEEKVIKAADAPNREAIISKPALAPMLTVAQLDKIAEDIETDLTLIGATAVEDKLQDNVPKTIADLIKASTITLLHTLILELRYKGMDVDG